MAIDSTTQTAIEAKINAQLAANPTTSVRDAMGNEVSYAVPAIKDLLDVDDRITARVVRNARKSSFDKFKFTSKE
jgi:hypothetical protein